MAEAGPLKVDTGPNEPASPPIAALFLVKFDQRKGYVVAWHKALDGVEVEGAVEFKSLPSGLHNVEEDLVYFIHDQYAGISAYINKPDEQSARNANMLAVGVLVPLERGKMGKSWLHADGLKGLARQQVEHGSDLSKIEEYWQQYMLDPVHRPVSPDDSRTDLHASQSNGQLNGLGKSRTMSTSTLFTPGTSYSLTPHHPATTLLEFLHVFGPLIFPLYRTALLRKRILFVTEAPVEFACNIVYNLSILSTLSPALAASVPSATKTNVRLRTLFNVGIQDIPVLSQRDDSGWLACTTDDVLATKPECFDVIVFLPSTDSRRAEQQVFPRIVTSSPNLSREFPKHNVRSTQRDAQRYDVLRAGLAQYPKSDVVGSQQPLDESQNQNDTAVADDAASTISRASTVRSRRDLIEPTSWSQVAYTSLLWWASAGDRRYGLTEEEEQQREQDLALLGNDEEEEGRTKEIVMIQFFRRLTALMFQAVQNVIRIESGEYEDEGEQQSDEDERPGREEDQRRLLPNDSQHQDEHEELSIDSEDMLAMSLDIWSASDRKFIEDFVSKWWARKANVRGRGIECCGVRIL